MRVALAIALAASLAAALPAAGAAPAQLFYSTSNTTIPPSQSFLLGGDQRRPLRVIGTNTGTVTVDVASVTASGETLIARVAPGEDFNAVFPLSTTARITNLSATVDASVRVRFSADTASVGMRYIGPGTGSDD